MLGTFDAAGFLPEGIHTATWAEFVARFAVTTRRKAILRRVLPAIQHLVDCGCPAILVGGSFVTEKAEPKDIDILWAVQGVDFDALHPAFVQELGFRWLKFKFGADIFPADLIEADTREPFPLFFQRVRGRDDRRKGVVAIDLTTIPDDEDSA